MTTILEVDDASDTMIIDCASNALVNQHMLDSDEISFDTALESVRILFATTGVESCTYEGRPALSTVIPASVIRLQRREFYRVQTPVVNPVRCTMQALDEKGTPATIAVPLYNVSGGGIAIIDEKKLIDADFGRIHENCRLDLPGGPVTVDLQIRSAQNITLTNGKQIRRLGCKFINPTATTLTAIQRYITKLQREQNARATGFE